MFQLVDLHLIDGIPSKRWCGLSLSGPPWVMVTLFRLSHDSKSDWMSSCAATDLSVAGVSGTELEGSVARGVVFGGGSFGGGSFGGGSVSGVFFPFSVRWRLALWFFGLLLLLLVGFGGLLRANNL